jgi:serine/threonine-protein kinase
VSGSNDKGKPGDFATDVRAPRVREIPQVALLRTGDVIASRYEIGVRLGVGGMGSVWRARDRELGEDIAVKQLLPDRLESSDLDRFRSEVKVARKITHPNVCKVFDLGEWQGSRFLTMELIGGESLRRVIERRDLPTGRALDLIDQILAGLEAVHAEGIVHRDLKPDNVMVREDGRPVVLDFGLAWNPLGHGAQTTTAVGTPAYMAPEQLRGEPVDARCDIFACGIVAAELLAREPPFGAGAPATVASAILRDPPKLAAIPDVSREVSEALRAVLARALARSPQSRYASAAAFRAGLAEARRGVRPAGAGIGWRARAVVASLVAAGFVATLAVMLARRADNDAAPPAAPTELPPLRVLVAPFVNQAGAARHDGVAGETSEAVGAALRAVDGIEVIASAYTGAPAVAATQANARWLVAGTITAHGDTFRLVATIRATASDKVLARVDAVAPAATAGALAAEVYRRVTDEARLLVRDDRRRRRAELTSGSAEARAVLAAYYDRAGLASSPAVLDEALAAVDQALGHDPTYEAALDERALLTCRAGSEALGRRGDPTEAELAAALAVCKSAIRAVPATGEPRLALARLHGWSCDSEAARTTVDDALAIDRSWAGPLLDHAIALALHSGDLHVADDRARELVAVHDDERRRRADALGARGGVGLVAAAHLRRAGVLLRAARYDEARVELLAELEHLTEPGAADALTEAAALRGLARLAREQKRLASPAVAARLTEIEAGFRGDLGADSDLAYHVAGAYFWTDPPAAADWIPTHPPANCAEAFARATLLHAAHLDQAAQEVLDHCQLEAAWARACVTRLRDPLAPRPERP